MLQTRYERSLPSRHGRIPGIVRVAVLIHDGQLPQDGIDGFRVDGIKVDPRVDNALAITTDGRKLATDARMLSATAPDFPGSKSIGWWQTSRPSGTGPERHAARR